MIGGLQYVTHTRLDIENVAEIVERFQEDPKESQYAEIINDLQIFEKKT